MLIGLFLTLRESERRGITKDFFLDFFIYGIPVAIICARIYYVVFRWHIYRHRFPHVFDIREGGLAIHGGIIGGFLVLVFLSKRRNVSLLKCLDILSPPLILAKAMGRWGNFINQEAYGEIVSESFISYFPEFIQRQMLIDGNYRNPTFFYMSLWNFVVFIFLIIIRKKDFIKNGDVFFIYIVSYSFGRFFVEGLRTDSLMLGPIRIAQLVSIILIIVGSIILYRNHKVESQERS